VMAGGRACSKGVKNSMLTVPTVCWMRIYACVVLCGEE